VREEEVPLRACGSARLTRVIWSAAPRVCGRGARALELRTLTLPVARSADSVWPRLRASTTDRRKCVIVARVIEFVRERGRVRLEVGFVEVGVLPRLADTGVLARFAEIGVRTAPPREEVELSHTP
jgi:hypothetical protein